jgi:hypothetical protein
VTSMWSVVPNCHHKMLRIEKTKKRTLLRQPNACPEILFEHF